MKSITIDLGHGGKDGGASNSYMLEKDLVLEIGAKLNSKLEKTSIKYNFTRLADEYILLTDRCKKANNFKSDYFVSIHLNSTSDKDVRGVEVWQYDTDDKNLCCFSDNINSEISKYLSIKNRGIKTTNKLTVLNETKMSACLIEIDFLSNDIFKSLISTEIIQDKIVDILYKNILELVGYKFESEEKYYRICIASFKDYNNAKTALKSVKTYFEDAFIHID